MTATWGDDRLPDRFWANVKPDAETGCWMWVGVRFTNGYGRFGQERAHRLVLALGAPIPDHLQVDHRCTVRACCNPEHLRVVTRRQNIQRSQANHRATSRYRGVGRYRGGWQAQIKVDGRNHWLGYFDDEWEAACAAHEARLAAGFFAEAEDWARVEAERAERLAA